MPIKPPNWAKRAVPTQQGWRNPRTNELLICRSISQGDIDEFYGVKEEPMPEMLIEAPTSEDDFILEHMSKLELEEKAREKGVELDRRRSQTVLVEQVRNLFKK